MNVNDNTFKPIRKHTHPHKYEITARRDFLNLNVVESEMKKIKSNHKMFVRHNASQPESCINSANIKVMLIRKWLVIL